MEPVYYVFALAIFVFLGLWISYPNIREIQRIGRISPRSIDTLPERGPVKVTGRAGAGTATSPITQTACALWEVKVEVERASGGSSRWVQVYRESSGEPFELYDETGSIAVVPSDGAHLLLWHDFEETSGPSRALDAETAAALEKLGLRAGGASGGKQNLRVLERSLTHGDQIYVLGEIQARDGRAAIVNGANRPVIISEFGEKDLLSKLSERAAGSFFKALVAGLVVVFFLWLLTNL